MEELRISGAGRIRAIEPHNVEILILNPDATKETALAGVSFRRNVEDDTAYVTEKLAMNVFEIVMSAVEVVTVREDHPGKTDGLVLKFEQFGKTAHHAILKAGIAGKIVRPID